MIVGPYLLDCTSYKFSSLCQYRRHHTGSRSSQKQLDSSRTKSNNKQDIQRRIDHLDAELVGAVNRKDFKAVADMGTQREEMLLLLRSSSSGLVSDAGDKARSA